jgi:hypothetical protein
MPITPFTTPLKTEYKPLGIDKFFTPLSQMQAKYDVAKTAIDDTKFKLARMSQDDPNVNPILEDLNQKTKELSQNLIKTGNYREAAKKLATLNKTYAEDKGVQAYKSSYDNYNEWLSAEEKRVLSEEITQEQLELAKYEIQNTWQGTTYDEESDRYNILNPTPSTKNMEKEFRAEALALAKMAEGKKWDELVDAGFDEYGDATTLKRSFDTKSEEQITREISNFLSNSDKYKNWIKELAKKRHFKAHNESKKYYQQGLVERTEADNVVSSSLKTINDGIAAATQAGATDDLNYLNKLKDNINKTIALNDPNAYEQLAENLAVQQAMGKFDNVAADAADLVDKFNVSTTYKTNGDGSKKGKERQEKFEKIGTLSTNPGVITSDATLNVQQGLSPFYQSENELVGVSDISSGSQKIYKEQYVNNTDGPLAIKGKLAQATTEYLNTFQKEYTDYKNNKIEERAEIKNLLASSEFEAEKKMYSNQLDIINEEIRESDISYNGQIAELTNLITEGKLAIHNQSKEIQDLWKASGKDPVKFLNSMENLKSKESEETPSELILDPTPESIIEYGSDLNPWPGTFQENAEMVESYAAAENNMDPRSPSDPSVCGPTNSACQEAQTIKQQNYFAVESFKERYQMLPSEAKGALREKEYTFEGNNLYAVDLLTEYNKKITVDGDTYSLPLEVNMDENFNTMTDEAGNRISNDFSKQSGINKIPATVYNTTTGELIPVTNGDNSVYINYRSELYDWEQGAYVGNDQTGAPIFKYPIKPEHSTSAAGGKTNQQLFNSLLLKKVDPEKVTQLDLNSFESITNFKTDNPDNIYLSGAGFTIASEVLTKSRDYLLDGIKIARGQVGSEAAKNTLDITLNNYAPLWLIENAERRSQYVTTAENLKKRQQAKIASENVIQGPAIWNKIDNDTYTAFQVVYITDEEGNLFRKPVKLYGKVNDEGNIVTDESANYSLPATQIVTNQLAIAMAKDAITYGVGRDADIPTDKDGSPIVISYMLENKNN